MSDSRRYRVEDRVIDTLPEAYYIQGVNLIAEINFISWYLITFT